MSLAAAVRQLVRPGAHLHLVYGDARPNAAVMEIVRQFRGREPGFTVSSAGVTGVQHALVAERMVTHLITSFVGESFPAPSPSAVFRAALARGELTVENWSLWTYVARLIGGALGLPFFPVRSLDGSGMAEEHAGQRYASVEAEFDGERMSSGVVRSLRPDLAVVHGVAADEFGNVVLAAPYGEGHWGALAARHGVLATVEKLVPHEVVREHNALLQIPGHRVRAICEVPFGSHPYSLFNPGMPGIAGYTHDAPFITRLQEALRKPDTCAAWLDTWVHGVADHNDYLAHLDADVLARMRGAAVADAWRFESRPEPGPAEMIAAPDVQMVAAAARLVDRHVREHGLDVILAGIGLANLASWLAFRALRAGGVPVELMAEIGMYGYAPRPGDPFVFANRNLHAAAELTDITRILGTYVSGSASRCLGVIGAAQVDRHGNVNSTRSADGRHLFGSGGANDIASAADDVLVMAKHVPDRLVAEVPYITSPGRGVSAIVTTEGVLTRRGGEFELTSYFARGGRSARERIAEIRAATGWELRISPALDVEPDPTKADVEVLRDHDPHGAFV